MDKFERKLKKTLKKEFVDTQPTTQLKTRIYDENNVNLPKPFSFKFKWSYACIFVLTIMCTTLLIFNITHKDPVGTIYIDSDKYLALVTIDVNPSIEMVIDEKNQVLSVYGNNDEGKMIIEGENIIGQNIEDVICSIIKIEKETKYLVSGLSNEITIFITTDEIDQQELLKTNIKKIVEESCNKNDIESKINVKDGKTLSELKKQVLEFNPTLNDDTINDYTLTNLINEVKLYQLEVNNFATTKIEKLYLEVKKQSISLIEQESIKNAINNLDKTLYNHEIDEYNEKYNYFIDIYNLVSSIYEEYFILEDSPYQQMLHKLEDKKNELNKQKKFAGDKSLENDLAEYIDASIKIMVLTTECSELEKALISIEEEATEIYNKFTNDLLQAIEILNSLSDKLTSDIASFKFNNIKDSSNEIYDYKNKVLQDFENKYKTDIEDQKDKVIEFKQTLKEN